MSPAEIMLIMLGAFLVALLLGHPLVFTLGGLAVIFAAVFWGVAPWTLFVRQATGVMTKFVYVCGPLYILMAAVLERSGVAEDMFESVRIVLGRTRGGMALSTVAISTMLAASTGIIGASITMMGMLALPSMLKRGYNKELATGAIMAGGCLGTIIPPSIILIIYGAEANLSIAKLFMGGVGSGLVLSGLYMVYIATVCRFRPHYGPAIKAGEEGADYSAAKKLRMTVSAILPPVGLIIAVLGSIFAGAATPTEAAAIGAIGAIIIAARHRRLNWSMLKEACYVTMKTAAMVLWIILAATMFTSVFLGLGGGDAVASLVLGISANRWVVLGFILFLLLIMGMLIDCYGILLIGIPLFTPIVYSLGFDPIWFGLLFCIMIQMSYLTPPFAYAIFFLKAISPPEIDTRVLYRAILPFVGLQIVGLIICMLFPEVITWLPSLM